jgi:hypothetical protein
MVKRFPAFWATILVMCAAVACHRGIDTEEAVRQGVIDYLSKRSNLNVAGMNVEVTSVSFRQNQADAVVAFTAKGASPGQPMTMRYTLERQGDHWVVKEKAENGANPHGAGAPTSQLPPGHPAVDTAKPKK